MGSCQQYPQFPQKIIYSSTWDHASCIINFIKKLFILQHGIMLVVSSISAKNYLPFNMGSCQLYHQFHQKIIYPSTWDHASCILNFSKKLFILQHGIMLGVSSISAKKYLSFHTGSRQQHPQFPQKIIYSSTWDHASSILNFIKKLFILQHGIMQVVSPISSKSYFSFKMGSCKQYPQFPQKVIFPSTWDDASSILNFVKNLFNLKHGIKLIVSSISSKNYFSFNMGSRQQYPQFPRKIICPSTWDHASSILNFLKKLFFLQDGIMLVVSSISSKKYLSFNSILQHRIMLGVSSISSKNYLPYNMGSCQFYPQFTQKIIYPSTWDHASCILNFLKNLFTLQHGITLVVSSISSKKIFFLQHGIMLGVSSISSKKIIYPSTYDQARCILNFLKKVFILPHRITLVASSISSKNYLSFNMGSCQQYPQFHQKIIYPSRWDHASCILNFLKKIFILQHGITLVVSSISSKNYLSFNMGSRQVYPQFPQKIISPSTWNQARCILNFLKKLFILQHRIMLGVSSISSKNYLPYNMGSCQFYPQFIQKIIYPSTWDHASCILNFLKNLFTLQHGITLVVSSISSKKIFFLQHGIMLGVSSISSKKIIYPSTYDQARCILNFLKKVFILPHRITLVASSISSKNYLSFNMGSCQQYPQFHQKIIYPSTWDHASSIPNFLKKLFFLQDGIMQVVSSISSKSYFSFNMG